jgi:hypothetical protein
VKHCENTAACVRNRISETLRKHGWLCVRVSETLWKHGCLCQEQNQWNTVETRLAVCQSQWNTGEIRLPVSGTESVNTPSTLINKTEQIDLTFQTYILVMLGSILCWDVGYSDRGISWLSSVPPDKWWDSKSITPVQLPLTRFMIHHSVIILSSDTTLTPYSMKIEIVRSSETSVNICHTSWRYTSA